MTNRLFQTTSLSVARSEVARSLHKAFAASGLQFSQDDILASLDESSIPSSGELALKTFVFSKKYKVNPSELVDCINDQWADLQTYIQSFNVSLPYINLTLRYDWLPADYSSLAKAIKGEVAVDIGRVVVEHTQPNTHKSLHVGHLRNTILGDTIVRLFRFFADDVYAVDYHGDEGTHVTKVIWYLKNNGIDLDEVERTIPAAIDRSEWLGGIYAKANEAVDALKAQDSGVTKVLAKILRNIEARSGVDYELWKRTRAWSIEGFTEVYDWLGVKFDAYYSESQVSEASQRRVDEFLEKGVFHLSDGAVGVDLSHQDLGFCMVRKSDGTGLYATKDIELAIQRSEDFEPDLCIYVVDQRQSLHFRQVFAALTSMGFGIGEKCYHLGYDVVQSKDGALSSRRGNAVSANELIERMISEATDVAMEKSDVSSNSVNEVALAAIRYGMLRVDPMKKVTFDAEEWTRFEGDTGPYLLYSYARAKSVLQKAANAGHKLSCRFDSPFFRDGLTAEQRHLLLMILATKESLSKAAQTLKPSTLCSHVFRTCQIFNSQYAKEKVLGADRSAAEVSDILLLYDIFCQYLDLVFDILGWRSVEEL